MTENITHEINLTADDIRASLFREGEIFITNAPGFNTALERIDPRDQSAVEIEDRLRRSCRYESVRIIRQAYDISGNPLVGYVAIVGRPKSNV